MELDSNWSSNSCFSQTITPLESEGNLQKRQSKMSWKRTVIVVEERSRGKEWYETCVRFWFFCGCSMLPLGVGINDDLSASTAFAMQPLRNVWKNLQMVEGSSAKQNSQNQHSKIVKTHQLTIGCSLRGGLSPLLWPIRGGWISCESRKNGFEDQGYAHVVTILVRQKFENTISVINPV